MTKQDYELIARAIADSENLDRLVEILCVELKVHNRSFDAYKFRQACVG
jgi:hypothetical protein